MENNLKRFDFFFSYAHKDADFINLIFKYISDSGYKCYSDRNALAHGMDFFESVVNGIRQSNAVILFISKQFMESQYCFKEAYMAINDAKNYDKLVIPVIDRGVLKAFQSSSLYTEYLYQCPVLAIDYKRSSEEIAKSIIKRYQSILNKDQLYDRLNEYIQIKHTPGIVDAITDIYAVLRKSLTKIKLEEDNKDLSPYIELIDLLDTTYKNVTIMYRDPEEIKLTDKVFEMINSVRELIDYKDAYIGVKEPTLLRVCIVLTLVSHIFDIRQDMINTRTHGDVNVPLSDEETRIRDSLLVYFNRLMMHVDLENNKLKEISIIKGVEKLSILGWRKDGEEPPRTRVVELVKKQVTDNISSQLFAIAKYINESNKLFEKLSNNDVTFEFLSCLKTSYERLKNYSELVGCKDVCAYCIDKLAVINQRLDNLSSNDGNEGLKEGAFKALLGLKQPEVGTYDVFISYNHKDEDLAGSIYRFLKSNLLSVFYDKVTLPQLGQSEYHDAIMNSLDKSNNFIIVLSDLSYLDSHWVDLEMKTFNTELSEGRKEGNFIFIVTDQVFDEISRTNKKCIPIQYRGYEMIRVRDYKDILLSYIKTQ